MTTQTTTQTTPQNKYTKSQLNAMRKDKLYSLCLKHFGHDTASIYRYYNKSELIDDLLTVTKDKT